MAVQQITQTHLDELAAFIGRGDRAGFYYHYYQLTGSDQALKQAQITTYSGPWGGAALMGNYYAKTSDPAHYKTESGDVLPLDQFSMDIVMGVFNAIVASVNGGGTGIFSDDEIQKIDWSIWKTKGLGNLFPGNFEVPGGDLSIFFSEGSLNAVWAGAAISLGKRVGEYTDNPAYTVEGLDDGSRFIIARSNTTGNIDFFLDKEAYLPFLRALRFEYIAGAEDLYNALEPGSDEYLLREVLKDYMGADIQPGESFDPGMGDPGVTWADTISETWDWIDDVGDAVGAVVETLADWVEVVAVFFGQVTGVSSSRQNDRIFDLNVDPRDLTPLDQTVIGGSSGGEGLLGTGAGYAYTMPEDFVNLEGSRNTLPSASATDFTRPGNGTESEVYGDIAALRAA